MRGLLDELSLERLASDTVVYQKDMITPIYLFLCPKDILSLRNEQVERNTREKRNSIFFSIFF